MKNVHQTILLLRQAGLSQTFIAKEIGVEQATVSRWEAGNASNSAEAALKLAHLAEQVSRRKPRRRIHEAA